MLFLVVQEFELLSPCLFFKLSTLTIASLSCLLLFTQFNDFVLEYDFLIFKLLNLSFLFRFSMLCLELLTHGKSS